MDNAARKLAEVFITAASAYRAVERRLIATGPPGLRLRFYQGVPGDVRLVLKIFACWLRENLFFEHPVRVIVARQAMAMGYEGEAGWAVFLIPEDYRQGDLVRIFVGGGQVEYMQRHLHITRRDGLIQIVHNLAHEVVHYEQWRDRRPVVEYGVNRRAAGLVRRWLLQSGHILPA